MLSPYPTPCLSPAQGPGLHSAGRCSVPSRLQHRGQARTEQGGAQFPPVRTGLHSAGRCSVTTHRTHLQHRSQACTLQGGAQSPPVSSTEVRPALSKWGADASSTLKGQTHRLLSTVPPEGCPGARLEETLAHDLLMDPQRQESTTCEPSVGRNGTESNQLCLRWQELGLRTI